MTQTPLFLASKFAETLNSGNVDLFETFIAEASINHNPFVAPGLLGSLAREVSVTTFFCALFTIGQ